MKIIFSPLLKKISLYFRYHPDQEWSIVSFVFLLTMLFVVRWNNASDNFDFNVNETIEMVELRLSEPRQTSDIQESSESSDVEDTIKEKPLSFGSDSTGFNDIDNSAIPPKPLFSRTPRYPDSMRKAGIEGVVVIELGINESGEVLYGKIVKSLGIEFDIAVIEWAKRVKFYPAKTPEKIPMKCRICLPIRFKLEG
jgi:TonB family protein